MDNLRFDNETCDELILVYEIKIYRQKLDSMDYTGANYAQELCESTDSNKSNPYATFDGAGTDQALSSSDSSGKSKASKGSSVGYVNFTDVSRDKESVLSANYNIKQLNAENVDEVTSGGIKSNNFVHNVHNESAENSGSSTNNESSGSSGLFETIRSITDSLPSQSNTSDISLDEHMMTPGLHIPLNKNDMPNFTNTKDRNQFQSYWKTGNDVSWYDSRTWPGFRHRRGLNEVTFSSMETHNPVHDVSMIDPVVQHIHEEVEGNRFYSQVTFLPVAIHNPVNDVSINPVVVQPHDEVAVNRFNNPAIIDDPVPPPPRNTCLRNSTAKKKLTIIVCICLCIVGAMAFSSKFNDFLDSEILNDPTFTIAVPIPDKCEKDIFTALFGERICIPYTQKFTSNPSGIHVRQLSSQYFSKLEVFSANVSSDEFLQQIGDWIINFNSSRTDQQFRFVKEKATCDSIGNYEITIDYGNETVTSFEFEIGFKDPELEQRVTRNNDTIHVHCEMIKTCLASSLALFVNDRGSSRLVPDINVCSSNDKENGTTVSADVMIPVSQFSENQTISCVPLMTDPELAANLTSTTGIPVCEGGDCVPDCRNDPQGEAYYPDKYICNIFHQCSNGETISQTCPLSTFWLPSKCTCVYFDDGICDQNTYRFFKPLMSIEKCTNASYV